MNRYFAIYHGLIPNAPWGVAVERTQGFPKVEVLMLCRTEKDANTSANLTTLGHGLKAIQTAPLPESEGGQ